MGGVVEQGTASAHLYAKNGVSDHAETQDVVLRPETDTRGIALVRDIVAKEGVLIRESGEGHAQNEAKGGNAHVSARCAQFGYDVLHIGKKNRNLI
jgi:hypothetical protein